MQLCGKEQCTGCLACKNSCPKKAIHIQTDKLDRFYTVIDSEKCVECGICRAVCHIINPPTLKRPTDVYAAWSKNILDKYSSSGGIAAVLSRYIINQSGVVYGTGYLDGRVKYIRINKVEDFELLRGSKYVESDIDGVYLKVKKDLIKKINVLFIGTPCHIAGLKSFLQKDYQNLLTVDLICHGVPPQKYLVDHVNKLTKNWDAVAFRGKYDYVFTVYQKSRILVQKAFLEDEYFCAFYKNLIFRENCYICPYAKIARCADITIGDFWGLDRNTLKIPYDGRISVVLTNSAKGKQMLFSVKDDIICEKRSIEEAANQQQTNLNHPSEKTNDREIFELEYSIQGFEKSIMMTSLSALIRKQKIRGTLKRTRLGKVLRSVINRSR